MKNTAVLQLECSLTDQEKLAYSKEMAEALSQKSRAEDNLKSFQTQCKAEIAGHEAKINLLAEKINTGREYRGVECEIKKDYKAKEKRYFRADTGELARVEPLSEADLQQEFNV